MIRMKQTEGCYNTYTFVYCTSTCLYIFEPYLHDHLRYTTIASNMLLRTRPQSKIAIHHCPSVVIDERAPVGDLSGRSYRAEQLRPLLLVPC
jgi:hypothetical protein